VRAAITKSALEALAQALEFEPFGLGRIEFGLGGAKAASLGAEGCSIAAVEICAGWRVLVQQLDINLQPSHGWLGGFGSASARRAR